MIEVSKPLRVFRTQSVSVIRAMYDSGHTSAYPEFIYIRSTSCKFQSPKKISVFLTEYYSTIKSGLGLLFCCLREGFHKKLYLSHISKETFSSVLSSGSLGIYCWES